MLWSEHHSKALKNITYLIRFNVRKVKQQTKYKYKRKLNSFQSAYSNGAIDLPEIKQVLSSYHAHLAYGHSYKLEKKLLNEFVLY